MICPQKAEHYKAYISKWIKKRLAKLKLKNIKQILPSKDSYVFLIINKYHTTNSIKSFLLC